MRPTYPFLRALFLQLTATTIPIALASSCGGSSGVSGSSDAATATDGTSGDDAAGGDGNAGDGDANCNNPCACYTPPPPLTTYVPASCDGGADDGGDGGCDCHSVCNSMPPDASTPHFLGTCDFIVDGGTYAECHYLSPGCAGRRPQGMRRSRRHAPPSVAVYLAESAELEAASVHAFRRLAGELARHGAPRSLVRGARRAERDETRHARTMTRLASRAGARVGAPRIARTRPRTVEQIARENATEGCVRETYGALIATWQAAHATDRDVQGAMRAIARDETRHAALAWSVAAFCETRLSPRARARIARARRVALGRLRREIATGMPPSFATRLGLPDPEAALSLLDGLRAATSA